MGRWADRYGPTVRTVPREICVWKVIREYIKVWWTVCKWQRIWIIFTTRRRGSYRYENCWWVHGRGSHILLYLHVWDFPPVLHSFLIYLVPGAWCLVPCFSRGKGEIRGDTLHEIFHPLNLINTNTKLTPKHLLVWRKLCQPIRWRLTYVYIPRDSCYGDFRLQWQKNISWN